MSTDHCSSAIISDCGQYRYSLNRWWDNEKPTDLWVMLNPSTADAETDDPTIRRVRGFSAGWGSGGFTVVNLYAYRATTPKAMWAAQKSGVDIIGPDCDGWIRAHAMVATQKGGRVIAAWGTNADPQREWKVKQLLRGTPVHHLGLTKSGQPTHPLYRPADSELSVLVGAAAVPVGDPE